jgi:catechol 2,3-dioxygenase-like lactoylglutathione lyase family enzyme
MTGLFRLGHISLGVSDLARSIAFYDAALAPLSGVRVWETAQGAGYGSPGGPDLFALKAHTATAVSPGSGFHLAFDAPDIAAVERFHAVALESGGMDAGGPGYRPHYGETYYAAFVTDPDGHTLGSVNQYGRVDWSRAS